MPFNVYLVDYVGMPRNHHGIFVETHERGQGSGFIYQVVGNIQNGMSYEHKQAKQPEKSNTFGGLKQLIGTVTQENYPHIRSIVNGIAPPKKQFNGPKKINPKEPLRRCQEWTKEAIQALVDSGVLQQSTNSGGSSSESYWKYSEKAENYYHMREDGSTQWASSASGSGSNTRSDASQSSRSGR